MPYWLEELLVVGLVGGVAAVVLTVAWAVDFLRRKRG